MNTTKNTPDTPRNVKRTGKVLPLLALSFAIAGFLLLRRADHELDDAVRFEVPVQIVGQVSVPAPCAEEVARYKREVEDVLADYDREVARAAADFQTSFDEGREGFAAVRAGLPGVVEQYRRFGKVKDVIVAIAADKIKKTKRMEALVEADFMETVFMPALEAAGKMDGAYSTLRSDLEQARQTAAGRLEVAARNISGLPIAPDLMKSLDERTSKIVVGIKSAISTVAEGWVAIGVAGGFELALVASTARSIGTICSYVAAKATVSAAAPAADGPLPVGDMLAVAGMAWTAYDIHKLTRTMPRKLQTALAQSVDGIESNAIAGTKAPAKRVIGLYKAETDEMRRAAYAPLKKAEAHR